MSACPNILDTLGFLVFPKDKASPTSQTDTFTSLDTPPTTQTQTHVDDATTSTSVVQTGQGRGASGRRDTTALRKGIAYTVKIGPSQKRRRVVYLGTAGGQYSFSSYDTFRPTFLKDPSKYGELFLYKPTKGFLATADKHLNVSFLSKRTVTPRHQL